MIKRLAVRVALLVALMLPATPAMAWWEYGHENVARIALDSVRPDTRAAIQRLLARGRLLDTPEGVLVWERTAGDDRRIVAVSFVDESVELSLDGDLVVEVASTGAGESDPFSGTLSPSEAVVLR